MKMKYPFYNEDPNLDMVKVKTIENKIEYKVNCKQFEDGWFVKNVHLIIENINGKKVWVKKKDLFYDHETKSYRDTNVSMTKGVVSVNKNGNVEIGFFTPNPFTNCTVATRTNGTLLALNTDILGDYFVEDLSRGIYYDKALLSSADIKALGVKRLSADSTGNVYNIVDDKNQFKNMINMYDKSEFPIDSDIKMVSRYIKDFKFGVEFETINGTLPQFIKNKYGIIVCKDGSLRRDGMYPPEYVTVPYTGGKGLQAIRNVSREITKRSDIDHTCSLHIHTEVSMDRIFLVSLYKLCYKIQNDIYKMFPFYKTNERKYANKEKNYCQKLDNIMLNYNETDFNEYINCSYENLYVFLTGGIKFGDGNGFTRANNPWGQNKWDIKSRYYWLNFTNLVFGKQPTIEFRIHTPTTNEDKVINWLLICNAIIMYAKENTKDCITNKKISLTDVLNVYKNSRKSEYARKLSENLISYYKYRVEYFKKDYDNEDYLSRNEIKEDANFTFNTIKI